MPSTQPTIEEIEHLQKQYQTARSIGLLSIAGVTLALLSYLSLALIEGDWRYWFLAGVSVLLLASTIAAAVLFRKKRVEKGLWVLILAGSLTFFAPTLVFTNMALIQGPGLVVLTGLVVIQLSLEGPLRRRMLLVATISGSINLLLDVFLPIQRPLAPNILLILIGGAFFFGMVSYTVALARQFPNFDLRAKITIVFISVVVLAVLATSLNAIRTTRTILLRNAQENLQIAATKLANQLDDWINTTLTEIRIEAQNPLFYRFLSLSPSERNALPLTANALEALTSLRSKNPTFIQTYSLASASGTVLLSTAPDEVGHNYTSRDYVQTSLQEGLPALSLWYAENRIYVSAPVRDQNNKIVGVLIASYYASILQQFIMQSKGLGGEESFVILLDEHNIILAHGRYPSLVFKSLIPIAEDLLTEWQSEGRFPPGKPLSFSLGLEYVAQQLNAGSAFFITQDAYGIQQQGAVVSLKQKPWKLVFAQPRQVLIQPINRQVQQNLLISLAIILVSVYAAYALSRVITTPLVRLTETARQIAEGHLDLQAEVRSRDEIGQLGLTFNLMTAQLRDLIGTLEERVAERTRNIERRSLLLQTAVEVGQVAVETRDLESLLSRITHLISQRFGFYHVGIFLLDERGEYAVLRAANSEGGQRMLARGHKLRVGQTGIVGYVTGRGEARIALDVGEDAVFFDNPDLPETRSEMALPLMAGGIILGALDVQSTEPAAFKEEDIATLQVMANLIAIAIQNAYLFAEVETALDATRRAYGEISRRAWQEWLQENASIGYLVAANDRLISLAGEPMEAEFLQAMQTRQPILTADNKTLFLPVLMRGEAIGGLRLVKPQEEAWNEEEIDLVRELVEQLSAALESARLFEETVARAERERTVAQVTTAIRSVNDPEAMLRIAMEELKRALNAEEIAIRSYRPDRT